MAMGDDDATTTTTTTDGNGDGAMGDGIRGRW